MGVYTMDGYTLQSYFKSLCESFCIAYHQLQKIEKEKEKIEKLNCEAELKMAKKLSEIQIPESMKDFAQISDKEKIEEKKQQLEVIKKEYDERSKQISVPSRFWTDKFWSDADRIDSIIRTIHSKGFNIVVTDSKEVLALMQFFRSNSVDRYRIINLDEDILESFPQDEMSQEFLKAYRSLEYEHMKKLCDKFF